MGARSWIKIHCDRWFDGTIRQETPTVRGIWVDILALAGSGRYGDTGEIKLAPGVGLTDSQISKVLNVSPDLWQQVKSRLIETARVELQGDNVIKVLKWDKYQSEYERQKKYRPKLQPKVTPESDGEKEKEKEKEKKKRSVSKDTPYQDIMAIWIELVPSLPKPERPVKPETARARSLKARWKETPDIEVFRGIFGKVQASDFLSGRSGKWTACNIDWVLKPSNWQKIKEGNYDNRGQDGGHSSGLPGNRPRGAFSDVEG